MFVLGLSSLTLNNTMLNINQDNPPSFKGDHHEDADNGLCTEYPGAACMQGYGKTALDLFDEDWFPDQRRHNLFYPWALKVEWELAQYLLKSPLSLADINEFLKLELVVKMNLSFKTSKEL
ncbi:hypothetical protein BT96DRAFT_988891 [Gymnopus androsaceus JB14]|uniref:Uncharacterized protein n=1 Tax=Gymnopus androsaceus JB14 TaxID=1447944 RepID=A0A6A4I573_9AGAR|nr:hypothetical protein BT96DRAFT_988891 [Gymnopus androsaceus JB14]